MISVQFIVCLLYRVKLPVNIPKPARIGDRLPAGPLIAAVHSSIKGSDQSVGVVMDDTSILVDTHSVYAVPQLVRSLLDYQERGGCSALFLGPFHFPSCKVLFTGERVLSICTEISVLEVLKTGHHD